MGSGSNNDSRIKKGKSKQKIVFAKNKNQAILAIFVMVLFFGTSISSLIKYFQEQNPTLITAQNEPLPQDENIINQQQPEQNSENLAVQNQSDIVDNSQNKTIAQDTNDIYSQTMNLQKSSPNQNLKTASSLEGDVEIIPKKTLAKKNEKMVLITVTNTGRSDPFSPVGENLLPASYSYLLPPPENLPANSDASKVITTTISGILYDKYSPSAIINIEGSDYLVKRGDVINNYKILSISKTQVIVRLGKNVYQAGVGELLSQTDLNYNNIANLNKKFGGNDVSINVKKKGY